ncbi:MAG: hypothetical protein H7199_11450 [Burkholderiales bacterium]|nr:hypothetical protein [Flavobacterium sp.]
MKLIKNKKAKFILVVLSLSIMCSCNKKNKEYYYPSHNIKYSEEYNKSGELKKINTYYDTIGNLKYHMLFRKNDHDSIIYYYKNGKIYKTGLQDFKAKKYGNWYLYTREGYLSEIREYFIIENNYILNRNWYLGKKKDTLWYAKKSNRYNQKEFVNDTLECRNSSMINFDFYCKDTISISEPFAAAVRCNSPLLREYNSQIIMVLGKENHNFNKTFSNEKDVKLDTFYNLNKDKINRVNFPKANRNYVVAFGRWFDKPGKKILRGYMIEFFKRKPTLEDNNVKGETKVYFEKIIYVKDTVK